MDMDNTKTLATVWHGCLVMLVEVRLHHRCLMMSTYDTQEFFWSTSICCDWDSWAWYYYEAMGLVIVPEDTDFLPQVVRMIKISPLSWKISMSLLRTKNPNIKIKASGKYLVLSLVAKRMKPSVLTLPSSNPLIQKWRILWNMQINWNTWQHVINTTKRFSLFVMSSICRKCLP